MSDNKEWIRDRISLLREERSTWLTTKGLSSDTITTFDDDIDYYERKLNG